MAAAPIRVALLDEARAVRHERHPPDIRRAFGPELLEEARDGVTAAPIPTWADTVREPSRGMGRDDSRGSSVLERVQIRLRPAGLRDTLIEGAPPRRRSRALAADQMGGKMWRERCRWCTQRPP
jgi:hypothetical protein